MRASTSPFSCSRAAASSSSRRSTCVEIKILRRVRAESSRRPPRHRRDACSIAYPTHWLICAQVPCDKKTSYETTNTTTVVNLTSYENVTVLENVRSRRGTPTRLATPSTRTTCRVREHHTPTQVTVTETVLQLENVTKYENVTREISYNVLQCINQIRGASRPTRLTGLFTHRSQLK